jgi:hypothetical protein
MESIRVRLAPGFAGRIFKINLECVPDRRHQAVPTMPRLAFNRKDTGWRIDWQKGPMATDLASFS